MKEALERAKQLRLQARERVAAQQLEAALELIDQALRVLETEQADPSFELYRDLAECWGVRGGILRRLKRRAESVESYKRGTRYEQDEEFGSDDAYNLVNSVVLPLYDQPKLLADDAFRVQLRLAIRQLGRQIRGARSDDYWAQADLARCLLLDNRFDEAKLCIDRFFQLGGLQEGYAITVQVLRELGEALLAADLPQGKLFDQAVEYFRRAAEKGSPLERPGCFVLMPFGIKELGGKRVDFDAVYSTIIAPAIADADLLPVRADAETGSGVIHKAMFERLLISEFAVADLTLNNPNVFYELGVRHGNRARFTVLMSAEEAAPFDVALLRTLRYRVGTDGMVAADDAARIRASLTQKLLDARQNLASSLSTDNPIAALLQDFKSFNVPSRLKADVFRDKADYALDVKRRLQEARALQRAEALKRIEDIEDTVSFDDGEPGVFIDLMLSYRGIEAWDELIALIARFPKVVRDTEFVREQQALALNRRKKGNDRYQALQILEALIEERGPSSEAFGLIGRIYKDFWSDTRTDDPVRARGMLKKAIEAYRKGFEADIRDAFPGINLLTLLELQGVREGLAEQQRKLPIVRYAAELRVMSKPDYWDHATLLEIAALARDDDGMSERLADALAVVRERLEPQTTARNLKAIVEARAARNPPEAPSPTMEGAIRALEGDAAQR
jgi:tetratricopeptide (TPR) repeat protein